MMQMVVLVLDNLEHSAAILEAWEEVGTSGVTILESTGLGRLNRQRMSMRDDLPLMPSLSSVLATREEHHRTIFTIVDSDEMVDRLFEVTQEITGDLTAPNRGIMFVLPVLFGWVSPYLGHFIEGMQAHALALGIGGDVLLLASLFVLGGDFWDKLRSLFIHSAHVVIPGK